jgi:dihydrofolate reductase
MDDNSTGRVVCDIAVSVDGYVAGPNQTEDKVFGDGPVEELHAWYSDEENADVVEQIVAAGAFVMGRNMFGPIRGEWDRDWRGWWGEDPPYHGPVFDLTHHPRDPVPMEGGTTFTFVADGIESALKQARAAAGDRDVAIAGGAATVNQYLAAGLLDELRLHVAPVVLGAGERLFEGVPGRTLEQVAVRPARRVTHVTYQLGEVTAPAV